MVTYQQKSGIWATFTCSVGVAYEASSRPFPNAFYWLSPTNLVNILPDKISLQDGVLQFGVTSDAGMYTEF